MGKPTEDCFGDHPLDTRGRPVAALGRPVAAAQSSLHYMSFFIYLSRSLHRIACTTSIRACTT
eukprot:1156107-Pyramimonas_sp.AAC.1